MKSLDAKAVLAVCFRGSFIFFLMTECFGASVASFADDDINDSSIGKRQLTMLRLGRGMQNLRLGKRLSQSLSSDDDVASPGRKFTINREQLKALFDAFIEEHAARSEMRRQPPLPRYGRRSAGFGPYRRNLDSQVDGVSKMFPLFSPVDDPVFRQPPRGGRYKREASRSSGNEAPMFRSYYPYMKVSSDSMQNEPLAVTTKAVPRPRIGRDWLTTPREVFESGTMQDIESGLVYKNTPLSHVGSLRVQTKAVPRPRIGRDGLSMPKSDAMLVEDSKTS